MRKSPRGWQESEPEAAGRGSLRAVHGHWHHTCTCRSHLNVAVALSCRCCDYPQATEELAQYPALSCPLQKGWSPGWPPGGAAITGMAPPAVWEGQGHSLVLGLGCSCESSLDTWAPEPQGPGDSLWGLILHKPIKICAKSSAATTTL